MRRLLPFFAALLLGVLPAAGQTVTPAGPPQSTPAAQATDADTANVIHVTDRLLRRPEAQEALRQYQRIEEEGAPRPRRQMAQPEVGDTRTFEVFNFETEESDEIEFTLQVIEERFLMWVETAELENNHVRSQDIEALQEALAERTPDRSFSHNPNQGVIANDEEVFGTPPDVDANDKSDVLLLDIRDDYGGPGDGFVAGFVDPSDLSSEQGNGRDILYLDTNPGIYVPSQDAYRDKRFLAKTAAHEYQHLIHLTYDRNELAFVNEGLSEWAEIVNGYTPRTISYLSDPEEYNRHLFAWDRDDPFTDYQRAGLFTNYLAERLGTMNTGDITKQPENAVAGYQQILDREGLAFEEVLADFHTTNYLNDPAVAPRFGYETEVREGILAEPTREYDGWTTTETPSTQLSVEPGGVVYLEWNNVEDMNLSLDAVSESDRDRLRLRIIRERADGTVSVDKQPLQSGIRSFPGSYNNFVAVVANVDPGMSPNGGETAAIEYRATWASDQVFERERIAYDDGRAVEGLFFGLAAEHEAAFANRFIVPSDAEGTRLDKVFLAPYFDNQFSNTTEPRDAPRDLTLIIWDSENGEPGDTLYTQRLDDPRSFQPATLDLDFFEVDLPNVEALRTLPDTVFVGYGEAGMDENFITAAVSEYREGSPYADRNMSFIGNWVADSWLALWDVEFSDGTQVGERVLPIRAEFAVPTAAGPPPVRLAEGSFTADPTSDQVVLTWSTTEEQEDSFFEVQRSTDGGNTFVPIDTLQGRGPTDESQAYEYVDDDLPFGADVLQYRLKFFSDSGAFGFSETIEVTLPPPESIVLHGNFPNPFRSETTIRYELTRPQHVQLSVYNMLGRRVAVLVDEEQEGAVEETFRASNLSSGVYVYVLETEDGAESRRMVLVQ